MRGLQAMVPGGDATQGSRRGTSTFSGASTRNQFSSLAATQDTLTTMAEDTGGRAFFDSNSFGEVFDRVVNDTSAYYVLGLHQHQPRARRPLPPHQGAAQAHRPEARISLRLLRAARLRALDQGRSRAAAAGSAAVRSVVDRSERLRLDRLLPPRRQPLLRPAVGRRARLSDSDHEDDAEGQGDGRRARAWCATSSGARWAGFATR